MFKMEKIWATKIMKLFSIFYDLFDGNNGKKLLPKLFFKFEDFYIETKDSRTVFYWLVNRIIYSWWQGIFTEVEIQAISPSFI